VPSLRTHKMGEQGPSRFTRGTIRPRPRFCLLRVCQAYSGDGASC
jgi:hypothetical protein